MKILTKILFFSCVLAQTSAVVSMAASPNLIVIYTDDHGHADLGIQGVLDDVKTPHTDALARAGARIVHGYSTAPQCIPSRGGLLTGRFQSRFGLEDNGSSLQGFNQQTTIAQRLQQAGYVTAQFGKWHLGPTSEIPQHGFRHVFAQNANRPFHANVTIAGEDREMSEMQNELYHIDGCSRAAASIIERYKEQPFFLYVAYRAPHVPLDAPPKYLQRFPGKMPERRRQALAMISAMDDGVGLITETLAQNGLTEKTLVFYISDNGAPLKIHKADEPGGGPGWDGSLNDPLNGEKGMLSEGGIHVPFVVAWPGVILPDQQYLHPLSTLDVAATAAAVAGIQTEPKELDGVNLIPYLSGELQTPPHQALYWRWSAQSAIREGNWKLLRGGDREYLYRLDQDIEEKQNLASEHPEIANRLRAQLTSWTNELQPPGLAVGPMAPTWHDYFDFYLEGKPAPPLPQKFQAAAAQASEHQQWITRGGNIQVQDALMHVEPAKPNQPYFITRSGLRLAGPVNLELTVKSETPVQGSVAWRMDGEADFQPSNRIAMRIDADSQWQTLPVTLKAPGDIIHLRIHFTDQPVQIQRIKATTADKKTVLLWR